MNQFGNGSWVESVKLSLPEHAKFLESSLDIAMNQNTLNEIDAHCCALAAAISSGNGELAFEISVNGPLFGNDVREQVTQNVISLSMDRVYAEYIEATFKAGVSNPPYKLTKLDAEIETSGALYAFAAALVLGNSRLSFLLAELLKDNGYTPEQLQDVANIAMVVSTINKVII